MEGEGKGRGSNIDLPEVPGPQLERTDRYFAVKAQVLLGKNCFDNSKKGCQNQDEGRQLCFLCLVPIVKRKAFGTVGY